MRPTLSAGHPVGERAQRASCPGTNRYSPPRVVTNASCGARKNGGLPWIVILPVPVGRRRAGSPCRGRGRRCCRRSATGTCTPSNWREMLAWKLTKTRPRSVPSSVVHALGQRRRRRASRGGSSGGGSSARPSKPSASRGLERRMCAPSGQRMPVEVVVVAKVVGAGRGGVEAPGRARRGASTSGVPLGQRPTTFAASLCSSPSVVELGRVAHDAPPQRDVLVELAPDHVRAVRARAGRPARWAAGAWGRRACPRRGSRARTRRAPARASGRPSQRHAAAAAPCRRWTPSIAGWAKPSA